MDGGATMLSAMMCFGYRNAAELALTICTQMDAQEQAAGAVIGSAATLDAALQDGKRASYARPSKHSATRSVKPRSPSAR